MKTVFKYNAMGTNPEALLVDLFHAGLSDKALEQIVYVENHKGFWNVGFAGVPSTALLTMVLAQLLKLFADVTWENDRLNALYFNHGKPTVIEFDFDKDGVQLPMRVAGEHQQHRDHFTHEDIFHRHDHQQEDRYTVESVASLIRQRRVEGLLSSENAGL